MDLKTLISTINQIAADRGIDSREVIKAVEEALAAAYKKQYREKTEIIKAKFDLKTGSIKFWQVKIVADDTTVRLEDNGPAANKSEEIEERPKYNSYRHILIEEAKKIKSDTAVGEELEFPLEEHKDFGRIAAQTAKQVILQKLREAEREATQLEFQDKEGEIISGIVQRFERNNVYVDLGRANGIMFANECIPGEHYRSGERLKFYILAVQRDTRTSNIVLSRSHPQFVVKLFELEVPEISEGVVEIKAIARESGHRTKIAVFSKDEKIDPVGSCVGQRGMRVITVTNELGNEKIDIVEWSEEPEKFLANSLSPAKVISVEILQRREAKIFVAENQLSLALGKGGENVRLAAKLTGWKLDIRSQARPEENQLGNIEDDSEQDENKGILDEPAEESENIKNDKPDIPEENNSESK